MAEYGAAGSVESNAYTAASEAEVTRESIMSEIKDKLTGDGASGVANDVALNINALGGVDISSGPGALVLDDKLQKLSVIEQSSAQLLSGKNRLAKELGQIMRS